MSSNAKERKQAERLFDQWKSGLVSRDRSHSALLDNFDELFETFIYANIDFDLAESFLKEAITAHLPSKYVLKLTFKKRKGEGISEQEFFEDWKRLITDRAKQAFFFRYPLPITEEQKDKPGTGGGMSKEEYIKQRKYANSFPSIDLGKIRGQQVEDDDTELTFSAADLGE